MKMVLLGLVVVLFVFGIIRVVLLVIFLTIVDNTNVILLIIFGAKHLTGGSKFPLFVL